MSTEPSHLSTLLLHRLRYGELSADAESAARSHLATCPTCAERLAGQDRHRAAFEAMPVPEAIRQAPANNNAGWRRFLAPAALAAAALLAVFAVASRPGNEADGDRPKGDVPGVEAWVDVEGGPVKVAPERQVHPGDRIQIRVRGPKGQVVTVAGKDGAGRIAVYGTWTADQEDGWEAAPFALALDDTPGDEQFFAIFAERDLAERDVRAAILRGRPPVGATWETVVLDKEP